MGFTHSLVGKDGFRLRGLEMSRVDGFSDVVFGFALTLIVASLEVPKTYHELHRVLLGFIPFTVCFVLLMMVWLTHFRFFRRFGLHDLGTILINAGLLFTVLFYVYPLKFLFTIFVAQYYPALASESPFENPMQLRDLTLTYTLGFSALYAFLGWLNVHAWRMRDELGMNKLERLILTSEIVDLFGVSAIGIIAAVFALILRPEHAANACFAFLLIGVWKTVSGTYYGRRIRALRSTMTAAEPMPLHDAPRAQENVSSHALHT